MGDLSKIQWTGATWNPWHGCIKISPGCKFCYMYRDKERYGQDPTKVIRSKRATFELPLKLQREVERGDRTGTDRFVFACSWSDWFIAEADAWRSDAWQIVRACPDLIFQVLTKRTERILDHTPWVGSGDPWKNVWLGYSAENQQTLEERSVHALKVPAAVLFLSAEPLLSAVDLTAVRCSLGGQSFETRHILHRKDELNKGKPRRALDWVIVGGESGNKTGNYHARPTSIDSIRDIVRQCRAVGVPCFVKQLGSLPYFRDDNPNITSMDSSFDHYVKLRDSHGGDPSEWDAELRVREFPAVLVA